MRELSGVDVSLPCWEICDEPSYFGFMLAPLQNDAVNFALTAGFTLLPTLTELMSQRAVREYVTHLQTAAFSAAVHSRNSSFIRDHDIRDSWQPHVARGRFGFGASLRAVFSAILP